MEGLLYKPWLLKGEVEHTPVKTPSEIFIFIIADLPRVVIVKTPVKKCSPRELHARLPWRHKGRGMPGWPSGTNPHYTHRIQRENFTTFSPHLTGTCSFHQASIKLRLFVLRAPANLCYEPYPFKVSDLRVGLRTLSSVVNRLWVYGIPLGSLLPKVHHKGLSLSLIR